MWRLAFDSVSFYEYGRSCRQKTKSILVPKDSASWHQKKGNYHTRRRFIACIIFQMNRWDPWQKNGGSWNAISLLWGRRDNFLMMDILVWMLLARSSLGMCHLRRSFQVSMVHGKQYIIPSLPTSNSSLQDINERVRPSLSEKKWCFKRDLKPQNEIFLSLSRERGRKNPLYLNSWSIEFWWINSTVHMLLYSIVWIQPVADYGQHDNDNDSDVLMWRLCSLNRHRVKIWTVLFLFFLSRNTGCLCERLGVGVGWLSLLF